MPAPSDLKHDLFYDPLFAAPEESSVNQFAPIGSTGRTALRNFIRDSSAAAQGAPADADIQFPNGCYLHAIPRGWRLLVPHNRDGFQVYESTDYNALRAFAENLG